MIGATLASARIERGISQAVLGATVKVCQETVSLWERGIRQPSIAQQRAADTFLLSLPVLRQRDTPDLEQVAIFTRQHRAACRAIWRSFKGDASPAEHQLAEHTRRHGYPTFGITQ